MFTLANHMWILRTSSLQLCLFATLDKQKVDSSQKRHLEAVVIVSMYEHAHSILFTLWSMVSF